MKLYANIIIDISHEKLDKTFQYEVPEHLRDSLRIGMSVVVPFGNGGRRLKGYVIELTEEPEFDPARIKEIIKIDAAGTRIESQLIALAAWMRRTYGATMNQCLKTVIPIKHKTAVKERKILHLQLEESVAREQLLEYKRKRHTARERLLAALIENPALEYEVVTGKLNVSSSVIRTLEEQCVLTVERVRTYRNPVQGLTRKEPKITLNPMQQQAVEAIRQNAKMPEPKTCLIHGVTGSGKTEVYMELIADAIREGKQSIVLIPEIALTYQTVMRFYHRFGERVSILNSKMSAGERYDQFERAKNGELDVMIGPRSALFTPFPRLGYIIIDEEHESSYKSETMPRYHARETAIERAKLSGGIVVLGSATPAVESYYRAESGEYLLVELSQRVREKLLPTCYIEDLRKELAAHNYSILSRRLQGLMEERLLRGEQTMLFLNRRGMSGFVSCRSCGYVVKCPHCDVSLSAHNNGMLKCHYCGYEQPMVKTCPSCGSPYIGGFKAGTQKIELMVQKSFPNARILRMDMDTTRNKEGYEKILSAFANQEADILIGTQMIVKGHDFPNVTLVGVLAADLSLYTGDYRAAERTFQLVTQAAGRAGRGEKPGEAVIQTYQPEHYSVVAAAAQDYIAFYEQEMMYRKMLRYPPVWNMMVALAASSSEECAKAAAEAIVGLTEKDADEKLLLIGPTEPAVAKVSDIYRQVVYFKYDGYEYLTELRSRIEAFMENSPVFRDVMIQFDFNPMNGF